MYIIKTIKYILKFLFNIKFKRTIKTNRKYKEEYLKLLDHNDIDKHINELNFKTLTPPITLLEQIVLDNDKKIIFLDLPKNLYAVDLYKIHKNKINWDAIPLNPIVIIQLQEFHERFYWKWLFENPIIFQLDFQKLVADRQPLIKELFQKVYHPKNVQTLLLKYEYYL
jgi:hypothetical protein